MPTPTIDDLLARTITTRDGCQEYRHNQTADGYGRVYVDLQHQGVRASRIVLAETLVRPLVAGECALHRCDNPPCIQPAHLFVGTRRDNGLDRHAKGRTVLHVENLRPGYRGPLRPGHARANLTAEQVLEVRRLVGSGVPQRQVADRYGLSQGSVWRIAQRLSYASVAEAVAA